VTRRLVKGFLGPVLDIETDEDPAAAAALAERVGLPRQKVNYHPRALEQRGLARVAESRNWGRIAERRLVATAASYVVSPDALGPVASDPDRSADRLSAGYLIALAARAVREVARARPAIASDRAPASDVRCPRMRTSRPSKGIDGSRGRDAHLSVPYRPRRP